MTETENTDGSDLETRVERLERLAGVEGVLPKTRRQVLTGLGGLAAGAVVGRSAADTATADSHGKGVLGATDDRIAGIYVQEDFGPTMSVDALDGGVSGLSRVDSLSGDSYVVHDTSDPTSDNGDVVYYTGKGVLYNEGAKEGDWVVGVEFDSPTLSKEADHLYIHAGGEGSWVTDAEVDLTPFAELNVEWENTGSSDGESYAVVSNNKTGSYGTDVLASISKTGTFSRTTDSVDVSDIDQSSFIRIHANGGTIEGTESNLLTYRVTLS